MKKIIFFAFSIKLIDWGVSFINRTGAEIGSLIKIAKKSVSFKKSFNKLKNTESAQLCISGPKINYLRAFVTLYSLLLLCCSLCRASNKFYVAINA